MKQILFIGTLLLFISCQGQLPPKDVISKIKAPTTYSEECSKFYWFNKELIDLDNMEYAIIKDLPGTFFNDCSKYAHRFKSPFNDTVIIGDTKWYLEIDNKKNKYILFSKEKNGQTGVHVLPVASPLPEVHEYRVSMFAYKENVIVLMEDNYDAKYKICKYTKDSKQVAEIENTYVTHPEPNTNYMHRYLYFHSITASQMIFTSHMAFADKFVTRVLNLDDFTVKEYDKMAHGIILDEEDKELIGFVTSNKDSKAEKQPVKFEITMTNGKAYAFSIDYADPACEFLIHGDLLYIANYHPIATGSSLHCFDMKKEKIIWTADVLQVNADHSEYYNKVTLAMYKDKLLMHGEEAYGSYLQIFDAESGKRLKQFGLLEVKD